MRICHGDARQFSMASDSALESGTSKSLEKDEDSKTKSNYPSAPTRSRTRIGNRLLVLRSLLDSGECAFLPWGMAAFCIINVWDNE